MPVAKVTSKGQITIPVEVRRALGIKTGDKVDFYELENGRWGFTARNRSIMDLAGCVPGIGRPVSLEEMDEAIGKAVAEEYLRSVAATPDEAKKDVAA